MDEIKTVHSKISPTETIFVIDAMIGQDAVNSASAFNETLPLTGVIVTKLDSDTRGGALISVRHVTGKPVKYIGVGESVEALERFHPDRLASRILGMGDVQSLIETVHEKSDKEKSEKLAKKFIRGKRFDLEDYRGSDNDDAGDGWIFQPHEDDPRGQFGNEPQSEATRSGRQKGSRNHQLHDTS